MFIWPKTVLFLNKENTFSYVHSGLIDKLQYTVQNCSKSVK